MTSKQYFLVAVLVVVVIAYAYYYYMTTGADVYNISVEDAAALLKQPADYTFAVDRKSNNVDNSAVDICLVLRDVNNDIATISLLSGMRWNRTRNVSWTPLNAAAPPFTVTAKESFKTITQKVDLRWRLRQPGDFMFTMATDDTGKAYPGLYFKNCKSEIVLVNIITHAMKNITTGSNDAGAVIDTPYQAPVTKAPPVYGPESLTYDKFQTDYKPGEFTFIIDTWNGWAQKAFARVEPLLMFKTSAGMVIGYNLSDIRCWNNTANKSMPCLSVL